MCGGVIWKGYHRDHISRYLKLKQNASMNYLRPVSVSIWDPALMAINVARQPRAWNTK